MRDHTLPPAVQHVVDAINAADTDAFVSGFADDGFVDDWGRVLRGPAGLRRWAESDAIGAGAVIDVFEASTSSDVTEVRFQWTSRVFNGASSAFVTVSDDRVSSYRIPPHA